MKEYRNYMFSFTPRSLYLQPHSKSRCFEEGINLLPLPGTELQSLRNPTCSLGTTPTILPLLITVLHYFIYKSKTEEK
jgi:hypothetical protein